MSMLLTPKELKDLSVLEGIITQAQGSAWAFISAVKQIKERKLYRMKYDTWEDYCVKRWNWTSERVRQIENSSTVLQQLTEKNPTIGREITNERQLRVIAKIPEEKRVAVVKAVVKAGKVTAAAIEKEAAKSKTLELDAMGRHITGEKLIELWQRNGEVQEMLAALSAIKGDLKRAQEDKDPMFAQVNFSSVMGDLEKVWTGIKSAKSYAVCPVCQGKPEVQPDGNCRLCKGKGLISEHLWKHCVDEDTKEVVLKGVKK
jgi:hypothetical protein